MKPIKLISVLACVAVILAFATFQVNATNIQMVLGGDIYKKQASTDMVLLEKAPTEGVDTDVVYINELALNSTEVKLENGETFQLSATIDYENISYQALDWYTSDSTIAKVDTNGKVTAVGTGTAVITAIAKVGNNEGAECKVIVAAPGQFADVPEDQWYYPYVKRAYDNGFMTGVGNDEYGKVIFKPLINIPREQFVTVLFAMDGEDANNIQYTGKFSDVNETDWYAKPIEWAAQNGIVSGIGDGVFGVGQEITREQMALMLYGYAKHKGYVTTIETDISSFPDVADVSDWAYEGMCWAIQYEIMSGQKIGEDIYLKPKDKASRAVCATMMVAFAEKYGQE